MFETDVYCSTSLSPDLLPGDIQELTAREIDILWRLFQAIGRVWQDIGQDSVNIKSDWLEFVHAKTRVAPSYTGEYSNAASCLTELINKYGEDAAYQTLLLEHGMPDPPPPPLTRVAHAKVYVINEFIRVQVAKAGFKSWKGSNYKGFIGGSRYNRKPRARSAEGQTA